MEKRIKFDIPIPKDILGIANVFKKNGFKLFVVGGAVRDALLGKEPKDYDLATDAVPDKVEEIMAKRNGYSHDFLRGHLTFVGNKIRHVSNENPLKNTMRNTIGLAELNFVSKGTILVDGLKLLKSIILELEKKLPKKFSIEMQETGSYTPYVHCIKEGKTKHTWIDV